MPIPPILTPLPNAKYRELHYEREAITRLKLHLLMARLRSGLRRMIAVEEDKTKFYRFLEYVRDEVGFVLLHIGYIHLQGFRIPIPYQVQDLADLLYDPTRDVFACKLSFHKDLNQHFNATSDQLILESTRNYSYWWKDDFVPTADGQRVLAEIIAPHFTEYYNTVVNEKYEALSVGKPYEIPFLDTKEDVPGLSPLPISAKASQKQDTASAGVKNPPKPPPLDQTRPVGTPLLCANCSETCRVLLAALTKLRAAQANIAMHIREGEEAAFRSCDMINGYTALEKISDVCEPFADGKGLPKQFRKLHPRQEKEDEHRQYFDWNLLNASCDPMLVTVNDPDATNDGGPATINKVTYRFLCFKEIPVDVNFVNPEDQNADDGAEDHPDDLDVTVLHVSAGAAGGGSDDGLSATTSIPSEFECLVEGDDKEEDEPKTNNNNNDDEEYNPDLEEDEAFIDEGLIID